MSHRAQSIKESSHLKQLCSLSFFSSISCCPLFSFSVSNVAIRDYIFREGVDSRCLIRIPGDEVTKKRGQTGSRGGDKRMDRPAAVFEASSWKRILCDRSPYMLSKRLRRRPTTKPEMLEIRTGFTTAQRLQRNHWTGR